MLRGVKHIQPKSPGSILCAHYWMGCNNKHPSWKRFLVWGRSWLVWERSMVKKKVNPGLFTLQLSMFWGGCPPPLSLVKDNFQLWFRWPLTFDFVFLEFMLTGFKKEPGFDKPLILDRTERIFALFVFSWHMKIPAAKAAYQYNGFYDSWCGGSGSVTVVWCAHNCEFIF